MWMMMLLKMEYVIYDMMSGRGRCVLAEAEVAFFSIK